MRRQFRFQRDKFSEAKIFFDGDDVVFEIPGTGPLTVSRVREEGDPPDELDEPPRSRIDEAYRAAVGGAAVVPIKAAADRRRHWSQKPPEER